MALTAPVLDPYCDRKASDIPEYRAIAEDEGISPDIAATQDGTFNPATHQVCCTTCYIKLGQPSGPAGWKAGDAIPG